MDATEECVDAHPGSLCNPKKARHEDTGPLLEVLRDGEKALARLGDTMKAAVRGLAQKRCDELLRVEQTVLDIARGTLEDPRQGGSPMWETAKDTATAVQEGQGKSFEACAS